MMWDWSFLLCLFMCLNRALQLNARFFQQKSNINWPQMHAQKDMDEQYENIMLKIKKRRGIFCNVHEGKSWFFLLNEEVRALGCCMPCMLQDAPSSDALDPFKLFCCEASIINWACRFLEQGRSEGEVAFRVSSLDRRDCHVSLCFSVLSLKPTTVAVKNQDTWAFLRRLIDMLKLSDKFFRWRLWMPLSWALEVLLHVESQQRIRAWLQFLGLSNYGGRINPVSVHILNIISHYIM